jgi:hypothetical protein
MAVMVPHPHFQADFIIYQFRVVDTVAAVTASMAVVALAAVAP